MKLSKKQIIEATTSGGSGKFKVPLNMAPQIWNKGTLEPFDIPVSNYISPELSYLSYDGEIKNLSKQEINKLENKAKKMAKIAQENFSQNDDSGNPFNGYSPPGATQPGTPEYIEKMANLPKDFFQPVLKEDLAVWFGTKKKPKGSKQPKGPWVNICRRDKNGKHPPCGRHDTSKGAYPKCRAAGVAGKMSDSQKKAACAQKRKAEKKDTQTGKGQKPIMTSYKTKKTKTEGMRQKITSILQEQVRKNNMLELGILFESKETKDVNTAKKMAQKHLNENPRYYCVLHRIGLFEGEDATKLAHKICPSI